MILRKIGIYKCYYKSGGRELPKEFRNTVHDHFSFLMNYSIAQQDDKDYLEIRDKSCVFYRLERKVPSGALPCMG